MKYLEGIMNSVTYLSGWKSELNIELDVGGKILADFNRLLVKGYPTTKQLKQGGNFENAHREEFIHQLRLRFSEVIDEGGSHSSLYQIYNIASQYLRWCDDEEVEVFTKASAEGYMRHLQLRVMLGQLKRSYYQQKRAMLSTLFTKYINLPSHYFENIVVMNDWDSEPFEAYSRSDLNQLLPFLRRLFNQTYHQFIKLPQKHIKASKSLASMTFTWQGESYQLRAGISKMMCAATYLLAYYTYTNTSDLFKLKQPQNTSTSVTESWYTMPAFKRRAFKTVQIEIGEHDLLEVPKYALDFFDKLLNASRLISNSDDAHLLQTIAHHKVQPMKSSTLQSFLNLWVDRFFPFTDQAGRRLRPVVSRFRETGSQLTAFHQGEMTNDIMLNNTPSTRKQHYSRGNKHTNNGMLQDVMSIRQEQVRRNIDVTTAQKKLGIDVLVIEAEHAVNIPKLSRTANGGSCSSPFGEKAEKYSYKARKNRLLNDGEKLACAELLQCFGCPNQVIVQSVSDIWCLLSFKACIEESLYKHIDAHHHRKNFEMIITHINRKIIPRLNKSILKQARVKLDDDGSHPLWDDSASILSLAPLPPTGDL